MDITKKIDSFLSEVSTAYDYESIKKKVLTKETIEDVADDIESSGHTDFGHTDEVDVWTSTAIRNALGKDVFDKFNKNNYEDLGKLKYELAELAIKLLAKERDYHVDDYWIAD